MLRVLLCIQFETPDLDQTARFRVGSLSLGQPLREHLHRSLKVCLLGRSKSCKVITGRSVLPGPCPVLVAWSCLLGISLKGTACLPP